MLSVHGQLAVKYGLRQTKEVLPVDFTTIISELTKLAQATHSAATFGQPVLDRIELLATVTELIEARMQDAVKHGHFVRTAFDQKRDSFEWCAPFPMPASEFDQTSLRAALSTIKAVTGEAKIETEVDKGAFIKVKVPKTDVLRASKLFGLIETFGLLDAKYQKDGVTLTARVPV